MSKHNRKGQWQAMTAAPTREHCESIAADLTAKLTEVWQQIELDDPGFVLLWRAGMQLADKQIVSEPQGWEV